MSDAPRVMVLGAHPDDCDFRAGGCAKLWHNRGCAVLFVSVTNGDAGHHRQGGGPLAQRRRAEAEAAGRVLGIKYLTLDIHDGELVPSLEYRLKIIETIREFNPELLITHRPWDYHPDHRYCAQLVQDAAFMVTVPNVCACTPAMDRNPVIMYLEDGFQKPMPFQADVVIDIDPVIDPKCAMLHEHASQVYEWLARGQEVPESDADRRVWVGDWVKRRSGATADRFRAQLIERYGAERGAGVRCAEAFEVCEYGSGLNDDLRQRLFPF